MPGKRCIGLAIALSLLGSASAHAVAWTEIPSGTTSDITALELQGIGRFWFTTADGDIYRRQGGIFTRRYAGAGTRLDDIEFQDGGPVGFAVGADGLVLRSTDTGDTWTPVADIPVSAAAGNAMFPDCTHSDALGDVNAVRFAGPDRVWIFAEGSQIARSTGTAETVGAPGTWVDANRAADDSCRIAGAIFNDGFSDAFFAPDAAAARIVHGSFADVFFTADALASDASRRPARAGRGGSPARVIAGNPGRPGEMWSVAPTPFGRDATSYTANGFASQSPWTLVNSGRRSFPANGPYDVDFAEGTVLAAGDDGMILSAVHAAEFVYVDDTGDLAHEDWRAVSLANAHDAAVGGVGGRILVTRDVNALPVGKRAEPGDPTPLGPDASPPPAGGRARTTILAPRVQGKRHRRLRLRIAGRVAGAPRCSGRMTIAVRNQGRTLRHKGGALRRTCRYGVVLRIRRVGRARRLVLRIRYGGNATALPARARYVLRLRELDR